MTRLLSMLTTSDVAALDRDVVIVQPIGAVEQHGAHLPLVTDALVAERLAIAAAEQSGADAWVLPTLAYGKSTEHSGWAGTMTLSTETLLAVCRDVGRSVAASGFRRLVFVNGHGGQPSLLDVVARDIRHETGLHVFSIMPMRFGVPESVDEVDAGFGFHGGHVETSLMMHLAPDLVHPDRAAADGHAIATVFAGTRHLSLEGAVPTAWLTHDVSDSGVLGDPTGADAAIGRVIAEDWTAKLAEAFEDIAGFSFPIR